MSGLPVPVRFELPGPEWEAVRPESLGVTNAAFLAVRRGIDGGYAPTITVSGDWRLDGATVVQIADESLDLLGEQGGTEVELVKRTQNGSPQSPGLTQSMGAVVAIDGRSFDLRQAQAIQAIVDEVDPARQAVLVYTLTCRYADFQAMGADFTRFLASIEILLDADPQDPDPQVADAPGGGDAEGPG